MMNLFYYIYYRLAHFYRRHHDSEPSSSAYCALCAIQSMTIAVLCVILCYNLSTNSNYRLDTIS